MEFKLTLRSVGMAPKAVSQSVALLNGHTDTLNHARVALYLGDQQRALCVLDRLTYEGLVLDPKPDEMIEPEAPVTIGTLIAPGATASGAPIAQSQDLKVAEAANVMKEAFHAKEKGSQRDKDQNESVVSEQDSGGHSGNEFD